MKKVDDKGAHYRKMYRGRNLDPARICLIYEISHPSQQGLVKKILCPGNRGKKSLVEDIEDIISGCERWLQIIKEDEDDEA